MSNGLKSLLFAAALCFVCSVLLTAASTGLRGFQERNILIDRHKNILKSVQLAAPGKSYSADEIEKMFARYIRPKRVDASGAMIDESAADETSLPIYLYVEDDVLKAYIIPITTRGLWGQIHGYLAVDNDGASISGFTVYKHSETPGLGGRIETEWFQKNFVGKKLVDRDGNFVSVKVAKGAVKDTVPEPQQTNYVDGISGATLTGRYLTEGLASILSDYEPVSIKFRNNKIKQVPPASG